MMQVMLILTLDVMSSTSCSILVQLFNTSGIKLCMQSTFARHLLLPLMPTKFLVVRINLFLMLYQIPVYKFIFTDTWSSKNNVLHLDFELYDNIDDAELEKGAWSFCDYDDPEIGFPRNCGKNGSVSSKWFTMPGTRKSPTRGINQGVGFDIYIGNDCNSIRGRNHLKHF